LGDPRVFDLSLFSSCKVFQKASIGNHGAVINGISLIDGAHLSASLLDHFFDHFLQSYIAGNTANNNHLFGFAMAHGPFSDFDQHG
jgi:hypothetical protein